MDLSEQRLVIHLSGLNWEAELVVTPPGEGSWRKVEFDVPLTAGPNPHRELLYCEVRYTEAVNRNPRGWPRWFVKVYRCRSLGDAEALRRYLGQQATDIQKTNAELRPPRGPRRNPVDPPWSVVPVHIVRCDGEQEQVGPIHTELAGTPTEIDRRLRADLPSWLIDEQPAPERYLLAVSPFVDEVTWAVSLASPATESLRDFVAMAAGIDALHDQETVHCDIKPANVCWYNTPDVAGYVLIDTDSVTPVDPPPKGLRSTRPYTYKRLFDWFNDPEMSRRGVDASILRAHDRFGFAVVVLTALAGKQWVERVLLKPVGGSVNPADPRVADDPRAVGSALRQLWPDSRTRNWQPLIEVLSQAFGPEIESNHWRASDWVQLLLSAERRCVVEETTPSPFHEGDPEIYADDLAQIRRAASATPSTRPLLMRQHGYQAIEQVALRAAGRAAAGGAVTWAAGVAAVVFVILFAVFG